MATPKKKYPYNFIYADGNYMTFDVTNEEYEDLKKIMRERSVFSNTDGFIEFSAGLVNLKDLRFVVSMKEEKPQIEEPTQDADPILSTEEFAFLKTLRGDYGG